MTQRDEPAHPSPAAPLLDRARAVGEELRGAFQDLLDPSSGAPSRPGELSRVLGVNRATASKLLGALGKSDGLEVLHQAPGPEPLRRVARGAQALESSEPVITRAERAVEAFDQLIRHEARNRAALDALITANLPAARERFELASKYSVFKGLAQLKGVQASEWLGVAVLTPSESNPEKHDLTWINGAVAMQRLRPNVPVRFSYRAHSSGDPVASDDFLPALSVISLDSFCVNPPAKLKAYVAGEAIHYTLPDELLGPNEVVDMFVVDHHPAAISRYDEQGMRRRTSLVAEPAVPVARMTFDVFLHDEVFPGSTPELYTYDTAYGGLADVNDPTRDLDRMPLHETVELLGRGLGGVQAEGLPNYGSMLSHLADRLGWDTSRYRGFRTQVSYPVYGWQVCLAFERAPR